MMIKVCGMREAANIAEVAGIAPTYMGFIFHDSSPRSAFGVNKQAIAALKPDIEPVGVFVNKPVSFVDGVCREYGIRTVQLHGDETPDDCSELAERGYRVFKAIGVDRDMDWEAYRGYEGVVDMFVLDSKSAARGGSGQKFDWEILLDYPLQVPYLLGGGVAPGDSGTIRELRLRGMEGVDLNSRFEVSHGIKDITLLKSFILSLRK